jgi:hypothetical protein
MQGEENVDVVVKPAAPSMTSDQLIAMYKRAVHKYATVGEVAGFWAAQFVPADYVIAILNVVAAGVLLRAVIAIWGDLGTQGTRADIIRAELCGYLKSQDDQADHDDVAHFEIKLLI